MTLIRSTPLRSANRLHSLREGEDRRAVGVFDNLGGFGLDGTIHDRQREVLGVEHFAQELLDPLAGLGVAAGADPPEIANAGNVLLAGHHPLEAVGQKRFVDRCHARRRPS